tara:strand:+ start:1020 stop:1142 length:123 start_codon:yes stop_codon:yes gene_type:complete
MDVDVMDEKELEKTMRLYELIKDIEISSTFTISPCPYFHR